MSQFKEFRITLMWKASWKEEVQELRTRCEQPFSFFLEQDSTRSFKKHNSEKI